MNVRSEVIFEGHVQGVGFRFSTHHIARGYAVTGFVRNLPNGNVEVVAEGEKDQVQSFVGEIKSRMDSYIHRTEVNQAEATGQFDAFEIRF